MASIPNSSPDKELVKMFEAAGVVDYLQYLQSSKKIMWVNFKAGIARGFGVTLGMTVVIGIFIWILTKLVTLPLIGQYFEQAEHYVQEYTERTNYTDEFKEMIQLLQQINEDIKPRG